MRNKKRSRYSQIKNSNCLLFGILSFLILFYSLYYINYLTGIQHAYDESGYWTAAAYFLGLDWTGLSSYNLYYSYGYGMILAIIMKVFSGLNLYQVAVFINAIFLVLEFYLAYYVLNKLISSLSPRMAIGISFAITIYPYNLFYVHLTVSEVILTLCIWLSIALFSFIIEKDKWYAYVLLAMVNVFMFTIHMRSIGCVIAALICLLIYAYRNKNTSVRNLVLYITTLILLIIISLKVKNDYTNLYYAASSDLSNNDFSGQSYKIKYILSKEGFTYFIYGIFGKTFGILSSTLILTGVGLYCMIKELYKLFKNKKNIYDIDNRSLMKILLILYFLALFFIGVIFLLIPNGSANYVLYTRYSEATALPLMMYGICCLFDRKINFKEFFCLIIFYIISALLTCYWIEKLGLDSYVGQANIAIWYLYKSGMETTTYIFLVTVCTVLFFGIIYILAFKKNTRFLALAILSILWIYISNSAYEKDNSSRISNDVKELSSVITEVSEEVSELDELYCYNNNSDATPVILFYIQLQNPDLKINVLTKLDEVDDLESGTYLISDGTNKIIQDCSIINKTNKYTVWVKE